MITTIMYKTFDGMLHESQWHAQKHLDKLYADVLCKLSRDLIQLNYTQHCEYIDSNLNLFQQLIVINNDIKLITDDDN